MEWNGVKVGNQTGDSKVHWMTLDPKTAEDADTAWRNDLKPKALDWYLRDLLAKAPLDPDPQKWPPSKTRSPDQQFAAEIVGKINLIGRENCL